MAVNGDANQVPPLEDRNLFELDRALSEAHAREGGTGDAVSVFGARVGSAEVIAWGDDANRNPPVLRTHDPRGDRIDVVDFHPSYHRLMDLSVTEGLHAAPWASSEAGIHVTRAAKFLLMAQIEAGHGCPISMTYSAVPALRRTLELAEVWEPRVESAEYDDRFAPAPDKDGALVGMALTERQGGSDVRTNTTTAMPAGDAWLLNGEKWFCSAPMCDAFLVLAQSPKGLSCFLMPRWTLDGERNGFRISRLKDKLGNRSNASSEVEFHDAVAWLVGEEGRGIQTILEMVNRTRLDCVLGSAAGMRQAFSQAAHHSVHRAAFGDRLVNQPLMQNVLADIAVESEAATLTAMRLAGAYDRDDPAEAAFRRLATPVAKYWVCKRTPTIVAEAVECLGGNGYVEESILPRLFRESPLNSIWEGSGNVIALDVLRVIEREPDAVEAFVYELRAGSADKRLAAYVDSTVSELTGAEPGSGRRIAERLALALQGSLLSRYGSQSVADAFVATRLDGDWGRSLGTLPPYVPLAEIVARGWPEAA